MYDQMIQDVVRMAVEHAYAAAYRLGLLQVDSDDPSKPWSLPLVAAA